MNRRNFLQVLFAITLAPVVFPQVPTATLSVDGWTVNGAPAFHLWDIIQIGDDPTLLRVVRLEPGGTVIVKPAAWGIR